jgi:hypothetical protein
MERKIRVLHAVYRFSKWSVEQWCKSVSPLGPLALRGVPFGSKADEPEVDDSFARLVLFL